LAAFSLCLLYVAGIQEIKIEMQEVKAVLQKLAEKQGFQPPWYKVTLCLFAMVCMRKTMLLVYGMTMMGR
jgi:hypothetical protein